MIANPTLQVDRSGAGETTRLSEQISQLEQENVQLEEALRRNTRIFEALVSNGHGGIALTGPDMRIVRVVKGLTDIDAAFLIGKRIDSLAVPEDRHIISDAYDRLLKGRCGKIGIAIRVPRAGGTVALHTATLTDMLDDPDVQGIVWNYSSNRPA